MGSVIGWGPARELWGVLAGGEFCVEFGEVTGDEGVGAGSGLDAAGDVTAAVKGQFDVDLVAGNPRRAAAGRLVRLRWGWVLSSCSCLLPGC